MEEKKKKTVKRSPNFPVISLEEAIVQAEKLYKADGRAGSLRATALKHLGYKGEHGASITVVSALKKYGLIREEGNSIYLTKESEYIFISSDESRRKQAIKECALKPEIYKKLWNLFSTSGLPGDETLRDRLIFDFEFNEKAVDGFITNFKRTLKYAEIVPGEETMTQLTNLESENEVDGIVETKNLTKQNPINKDTKIQEYLIPRKGDKVAILKLEKPVSNEDIDLIVKWLELLRSTIVDKEETVNE